MWGEDGGKPFGQGVRWGSFGGDDGSERDVWFVKFW